MILWLLILDKVDQIIRWPYMTPAERARERAEEQASTRAFGFTLLIAFSVLVITLLATC